MLTKEDRRLFLALFGWGMVVHLLLSAGLYRLVQKNRDDSRIGN